MSIDPNNISFVVQGPVVKHRTAHLCQSIRQHFPGAELIVSTWTKQEVSALREDKLCDILMQFTDVSPGHMNVNRQLYSTMGGMQMVKRPYTCKVRSDALFTNDNVLHEYVRFSDRGDDLRVFRSRIAIPSFTCYDPRNEASSFLYHRCFQFSDWAAFGRTEDVRHLFSAKRQALPDARKSPEQYIWLSAIQRTYPEIDIRWMCHRDEKLMQETEVFCANNLIVLDMDQFGLRVAKYNHLVESEPQWLTHKKWLGLYQQWGNQAVLTPTTK